MAEVSCESRAELWKTTTRLPEPGTHARFGLHHALAPHPLAVYADLEVFTQPLPAGVILGENPDGPTRVLGVQSRVASYACCAVGYEGFEVLPAHRMVLRRSNGVNDPVRGFLGRRLDLAAADSAQGER